MTIPTSTVKVPPPSARSEERILAPFRLSHLKTRTWFLVTLVGVILLHAGLVAMLFFRDGSHSMQVEPEQTPVEVVVEEPEPPPKRPDLPKPEPEQKQEIEKPASSAPRKANEEKIETASLQDETHAPASVMPPRDGNPQPAEESATEEATTPADKDETAATKPDVVNKDAEALDKFVPEPPKRPQALAKQVPHAKVKHLKTALQQLAGASSLPDFSFARPSKKSPIDGGTEDSRYLAIVYGMIMAHRSRIEVPGDGGNVTLTFNVDDQGYLVDMDIRKTSGNPDVDAEAASAIRRASPFPPPPPGAPHSLIATIDFGREPVDDRDSRGP